VKLENRMGFWKFAGSLVSLGKKDIKPASRNNGELSGGKIQ
jgi:hypothetical protein